MGDEANRQAYINSALTTFEPYKSGCGAYAVMSGRSVFTILVNFTGLVGSDWHFDVHKEICSLAKMNTTIFTLAAANKEKKRRVSTKVPRDVAAAIAVSECKKRFKDGYSLREIKSFEGDSVYDVETDLVSEGIISPLLTKRAAYGHVSHFDSKLITKNPEQTVMVMTKLDGNRGLVLEWEGSLKCITRNSKEYPSWVMSLIHVDAKRVIDALKSMCGIPDAMLDGELYAPSFSIGEHTSALCVNQTKSHAVDPKFMDDLSFYVFDFKPLETDAQPLTRSLSFSERSAALASMFESIRTSRIQYHTGKLVRMVDVPQELDAAAACGEEGIVVYLLDKPYEAGTATGKLKYKKKYTMEGLVIGMKKTSRNANNPNLLVLIIPPGLPAPTCTTFELVCHGTRESSAATANEIIQSFKEGKPYLIKFSFDSFTVSASGSPPVPRNVTFEGKRDDVDPPSMLLETYNSMLPDFVIQEVDVSGVFGFVGFTGETIIVHGEFPGYQEYCVEYTQPLRSGGYIPRLAVETTTFESDTFALIGKHAIDSLPRVDEHLSEKIAECIVESAIECARSVRTRPDGSLDIRAMSQAASQATSSVGGSMR